MVILIHIIFQTSICSQINFDHIFVMLPINKLFYFQNHKLQKYRVDKFPYQVHILSLLIKDNAYDGIYIKKT